MARVLKNDLTIIYYTANSIPEHFTQNIRNNLIKEADGIPIIWVSKKPLGLENNIVVDTPRSHLNIYKDALVGVKAAKTMYVAMAEDDVLYSSSHFARRPSALNVFAYNMNYWNIHTWDDPLYSQKLGGRRNLHSLICSKDQFIKAMEERFAKYPDGLRDYGIWAEPGKYEKHLGVTEQQTEGFCTNPPNVVFTHQTALSFNHLGRRKRLGEIRALEIPHWGHAKEIRKVYEDI